MSGNNSTSSSTASALAAMAATIADANSNGSNNNSSHSNSNVNVSSNEVAGINSNNQSINNSISHKVVSGNSNSSLNGVNYSFKIQKVSDVVFDQDIKPESWLSWKDSIESYCKSFGNIYASVLKDNISNNSGIMLLKLMQNLI